MVTYYDNVVNNTFLNQLPLAILNIKLSVIYAKKKSRIVIDCTNVK